MQSKADSSNKILPNTVSATIAALAVAGVVALSVYPPNNPALYAALVALAGCSLVAGLIFRLRGRSVSRVALVVLPVGLLFCITIASMPNGSMDRLDYAIAKQNANKLALVRLSPEDALFLVKNTATYSAWIAKRDEVSRKLIVAIYGDGAGVVFAELNASGTMTTAHRDAFADLIEMGSRDDFQAWQSRRGAQRGSEKQDGTYPSAQ